MPTRIAPFIFLNVILLFSFSIKSHAIEYVTSFGGIIRDSVVCKGHAYLSQRDTIRILDIQDKNNIHEIGAYIDAGLEIGHMAIKWPVLYYEIRFRSDFRDVGAIDITDPYHPRKLEENFICRRAEHYGLEIKGSWLRIRIDGSDEGWIYDITDPFNPVIKARDEEDDNAAIRGMNIMQSPVNEEKPRIPKEIMYAECINNVKAIGRTLYVIDEGEHISSIDIANPAKPQYTGVIKDSQKIRKIMESNPTDWRCPIQLGNKYVIDAQKDPVETTKENIVFRDVSHASSPRILNDTLSLQYHGHDHLGGFRILDSILFVLTEGERTSYRFHGLSAIDISNIKNPRFIGAYPEYSSDGGFEGGGYRVDFETEADPGGISVSGNMIYIACHNNGLTILRFTKEETASLTR